MKEKHRTVEFEVLRGLIAQGQLSDAASELIYIQAGDERVTLLSCLIDAGCEDGMHAFVKKLFQDFDTAGLSRDLIRKVHALADEHEVDSDFQESLPTVVGPLPI